MWSFCGNAQIAQNSAKILRFHKFYNRKLGEIWVFHAVCSNYTMKYVARYNDKGYCGAVNEMVFLKLFYSDGLLKPALTDEEAIGLTHFRPMFPFYTP